MNKRIILVLTLVLLLTGCNDTENNNTDANKPETTANESIEITQPENQEEAKETISESKDDSIIEIKEKMFIAQTNDVYINTDDYLGKTIKYQGIYTSYYNDVKDETYSYVIRYGPGCCGYDGTAGFEVIWDGELPQENDWVEAVGTVDFIENGENQFLVLKLSSLTVLDERGSEIVTQ